MNRRRVHAAARWWGGCLLVAGVFGAVGSAHAGGTLAQAMEAAWQRADAARLAQGDQAAAEGLARGAQRWWAQPPTVGVQHRSDRFNEAQGRQEWALELSVPLWQSGQRSASAQAAQAALARAQAAQHAARWRLAGEVRETAWRMQTLQVDLAQASAAVESAARLAADVKRRVQVGELPRTDALAAQAEELAARQRQAEAQVQWQAAQLQWQRLTGLAQLPTSLDEAVPSEARPGNDHPALQELAGTAQDAARQRDVVRATGTTAPELTLGWQHDVGQRGQAAQRSVTLGVRLPLGRDDRQQALLAQAEAAADVAHNREQREREQVQASATVAAAAVRQAQAGAQAATEQAALLRERADLLQRAFTLGEQPLVDLLRAQTAARDAERTAARQQAQLGLARAQWLQSLGQIP